MMPWGVDHIKPVAIYIYPVCEVTYDAVRRWSLEII